MKNSKQMLLARFIKVDNFIFIIFIPILSTKIKDITLGKIHISIQYKEFGRKGADLDLGFEKGRLY